MNTAFAAGSSGRSLSVPRTAWPNTNAGPLTSKASERSRAAFKLVRDFVTLPTGRVGPKGRRGGGYASGRSLPGSPPRTLRVGFAGEPWANAQRLILSGSGRARLLPSRLVTYRFRVYCACGGRHTECACYINRPTFSGEGARLGRSLPGSPPRTLRVGFAGEPWANAQRLILSGSGRARLPPSRLVTCRFRVYCACGGRHTECACYINRPTFSGEGARLGAITPGKPSSDATRRFRWGTVG